MDYDDDYSSGWTGPYFKPERYGLEYLGEINTAGAYEYNTLAVWLRQDGQWSWAHDSGCSCPTPFEYVQEEDLQTGDWNALAAACEAHVQAGEGRYADSYGRERMLDLLTRARNLVAERAEKAEQVEEFGHPHGSTLAWRSESGKRTLNIGQRNKGIGH